MHPFSDHIARVRAADLPQVNREMSFSAAGNDNKLQQLYLNFDNYYGTISNEYGTYPVSQTVFSNNKGKIISKISLQCLNVLSRLSRTLLVGNTCAPAFFFPEIDPKKGLSQFQLSGGKSCGSFIFNTLRQEGEIFQALRVEAEPFMVLQIRKSWKSFENYLADLSSKYRVRTRKVFTCSEAFSDRIFTGKEIDAELVRDCAKLLRETLKEKTLAMSKDQEKVIYNFLNVYAENYRIRAYYLDGKLMAFLSTVQIKDSLLAMQVGYDAGIAKDSHIYQRMLYDSIDFAIQHNICSINFGRTATEIKSTLGAEPIENEYLIFVNNQVTRFIARAFAPYFYRKKDFVIRKPFK